MQRSLSLLAVVAVLGLSLLLAFPSVEAAASSQAGLPPSAGMQAEATNPLPSLQATYNCAQYTNCDSCLAASLNAVASNNEIDARAGQILR